MRKHHVVERFKKILEERDVVYDPPLCATLNIVAKNGTQRSYAVAVIMERDGVWVVKHSRPSGRWKRDHRATHAGTVKHKDQTTKTGVLR